MVALVALVAFSTVAVKVPLMVTLLLNTLFPAKVWVPVVIRPAAVVVAAGIVALFPAVLVIVTAVVDIVEPKSILTAWLCPVEVTWLLVDPVIVAGLPRVKVTFPLSWPPPVKPLPAIILLLRLVASVAVSDWEALDTIAFNILVDGL